MASTLLMNVHALGFQSRALDAGFFIIGLIVLALAALLTLLLLLGVTAILGLFSAGSTPRARKGWRITALVIRVLAWLVPLSLGAFTVHKVLTWRGLPVLPDALLNLAIAMAVLAPLSWWVDRRARRLRDKHQELGASAAAPPDTAPR